MQMAMAAMPRLECLDDSFELTTYCMVYDRMVKQTNTHKLNADLYVLIQLADDLRRLERYKDLFDLEKAVALLDPKARSIIRLRPIPKPTQPILPDDLKMDLDSNESAIAETGNEVPRSLTPVEEVMRDSLDNVPDSVPPFIFLKCMDNYAATLSQLSALLPFGFVSKVAGEFIRITPCSMTDSDSILEFLKVEKQEFFLGSCAPYKVVVKGLPLVTACGDLVFELTKMGFEPTKVTRPTSRNGKHPLSMLVVESPRRPGNNQLLKISTLFGVHVKVEPFRRRSNVMQCYNCNWFGHAATHCHMKARCLKCGEGHATRDCILPRRDDPTCINCLQTGHVACSRSCPKFPKRPPTKRNQARSNFVKRPSHKFNSARPNHSNPPAKSKISKTCLPPSPNLFNSPSTFCKQQLSDVALLLELFKQLSSIFSGENGLKSLIQRLQGKDSAVEKLQEFLDFFAAADATPTGQSGAANA